MKLIFPLLLLFASLVQAQQKKFAIDWVDEKNVSTTPGGTLLVPGFSESNFSYDSKNKTLLFSSQWQESGNISSAELMDVTYVNIPENLLTHIDKSKLPKSPVLDVHSSSARGKEYAVLNLTPIINDNGVYKKITSFQVNYSKGMSRNSQIFSSVPPVSNSVLANGSWYRFYVDKSGVYQISRSFLNSLGMDVNNIDPRKLKIYGHGGDMLPLENAENIHYDLPQTSIQVKGEGDGSFDPEDYVVFYAKAVDDEWSEENSTNLNLYAERSYYYITADGDNGLRINDYAEPTGNASHTIQSFDDYQFYEVDEYNVVKVGRRWFGDRFDVQNERGYEFEFENIITSEPVEVEVYAASVSEASTSMNISVNGQNMNTLSFSPINDGTYGSGAGTTGNVDVNSSQISVDITYNNGGNPASMGYLDYINLKAKRSLEASNKQFEFFYEDAASLAGIGQYVIQNTAQISEVWDITDLKSVRRIVNESASSSSSSITFKAPLGESRKYIAISPADYYTPLRENNSSVDNLNLKGSLFRDSQGNFQDVDYLMITSDLLLQQANRLAQYRRDRDNLNVKVVLLEDIYTEFNSGKQDIAAIRNLVKYVYENASSPSKQVKYLCLFGDASVDYKDRLQGNNNIVPTYENLSVFSVGAATAASDDFFGMMDANEGSMGNNDKLDIAVGRILADSPQLAAIVVDKIIAYESRESYGRWRNNFVLISDDADTAGSGGYELQEELDDIGDEISDNKPFINVKKIHSDAYQQMSSAGGYRYPEVNEDITEAVEVGASVINYFGHGGENGLSSERIITVNDILSWNNENKYNLFVTVTCEFTRFDNPLRLSPGETNLLKEKSGSVAMVTTTRSIPVSTGTDFNEFFAPYLFNYDGGDDSIAEAVRKAKNDLSGTSKRVIFYFGDPAMKLALPDPEIKLTAINDIPITQAMDTLKALGRVRIAGEVVNTNGNIISNYDGVLATTIFDKRIERQTLGNDGISEGGELLTMDFTTLGEIIFRGQASVSNGKFEFDFVVPKDISIPVGNGRISFYSERDNVLQDNRGYNNDILVGGINDDAPEDNLGPQIQMYMNDENFVSGGITNASPILLVKLEDENGINTASGIGHDLVAILDGDETNPYVVNDYYETEVDDYTKGNVNYQLRDLEEGLHTLTFKAWDVYNNSSIAEIQFMVAEDDDLKISKVLNYPNPFNNYTEFWFNHNRPFEPLEVQVQVFTVTGKVVWTRNQLINTDGFLSRDITWNGKDDFGDSIGKGVYVYKLTVKSTLTNKKVEKFEKLVIL